jgi:hypothetical protein
VVVSVVVVSFFWQPVESATAAMAARPRVRNFFINLISFLLKRCLGARKSKPSVGKSTRNHIRTGPPVNPKGDARLGVTAAIAFEGRELRRPLNGENGGY